MSSVAEVASWAFAATMVAAAPALASEPVALVEDVTGSPVGVQPM